METPAQDPIPLTMAEVKSIFERLKRIEAILTAFATLPPPALTLTVWRWTVTISVKRIVP